MFDGFDGFDFGDPVDAGGRTGTTGCMWQIILFCIALVLFIGILKLIQ